MVKKQPLLTMPGKLEWHRISTTSVVVWKLLIQPASISWKHATSTVNNTTTSKLSDKMNCCVTKKYSIQTNYDFLALISTKVLHTPMSCRILRVMWILQMQAQNLSLYWCWNFVALLHYTLENSMRQTCRNTNSILQMHLPVWEIDLSPQMHLNYRYITSIISTASATTTATTTTICQLPQPLLLQTF